MTSTITKQEYSVYYGISELKRLQTAHSLAFDTETLQLQPEEGKLRLIQLGCFMKFYYFVTTVQVGTRYQLLFFQDFLVFFSNLKWPAHLICKILLELFQV